MDRSQLEVEVEKFFNWNMRKYKNVSSFQQQVNFAEHIQKLVIDELSPGPFDRVSP